MLKVCLTHDIDRVFKSYQYVSKLLRGLKQRNTNALKMQFISLQTKNPYWGFDRLIEIENSYNVKSTIFFLNESIKFDPLNPKSLILSRGRYKIDSERISDIIRYLDTKGWEIGVHGSYNSYKSLNLLKKEKHELEHIVGHEVRGIRQHYLNLNQDTWALQREAGFSYDSSLGSTTDIGFKDHIVSPLRLFDDRMVVFPLALMDMCFVNHPNKWLALDEIISECEKHDAVLVVNFHQHVFHVPDFPGWGDDYTGIIERCLARNATFKTMGQHYDDLTNRLYDRQRSR